MIGAIAVVIAGVLVAWWAASMFTGRRSYGVGILVALLIVPAIGFCGALLDGLIVGGDPRQLRGTSVGLGLAVALIEVPLLIFKRKRRLQ